jgi:hypothetical protein
MTNKYLFVAACIVIYTLLGYFQFPGHTYLQSDTQIYVPILEHYWDDSVLRGDLVAQYPHVSFTIYDEVTLWLRRTLGMDTEHALALQQLVFRALGILGVFLISTGLGLSYKMALLVSAIFSLGATVMGPSILTFEYEPIPRGFAVPLVLLAIGLAGHGRCLGAGIAAAMAFLYQAPSGYTFWIVYFGLVLWPAKPIVMRRRILGLIPLLLAVILMLILSRHQPGVREPQDFVGRISPFLEKIQRIRAPYNWVSLWPRQMFWHYLFLAGVCFGAFFRIKRFINKDLQVFVLGMTALGLLSLPASYVLLEVLKWDIVPQFQPMRAVMFITVFCCTLAATSGIYAARNLRRLEGLAWFAVAFAIPIDPQVLRILLPRLDDPLIRRRVLLMVALSTAAVIVVWADERRKKWSSPAWAALVVIPFFLLPAWGKIVNYPKLWSPELRSLAEWARTSTPKDAVFLFPDAGKQLYPGIFRATALRAVYTDWKTGGQVNFFPKLAEEWWRRWQLTMAQGFNSSKVDLYRSLGINYIVVQGANRVAKLRPVYENHAYVVYRLTD